MTGKIVLRVLDPQTPDAIVTKLKVVAAERSLSRSLSPATPTRDVQEPSGDGVAELDPGRCVAFPASE